MLSRLGWLSDSLLEIGHELRAEIPDPLVFLGLLAETVLETAPLISPWDPPEAAIDRLAELQGERLSRCRHRGSSAWQRRPAQEHLACAFWQLAGMYREVSCEICGARSDGQLEEHAADFANYLLFAALTSGAWDLTLGGGLLPPGLARHSRSTAPTSPPDFPALEFPRVGSKKGGRR